MASPDPRLPAVLAAQQRFWEALKAKDAALFERLLAPNFVSRSPGEADQNRAAFIANLTSFPATVLAVSGDELTVHFFGETAVVMGVQRAQVALPNGDIVANDIAITNVYVPGGAGWRLALAHPVTLP